MALRHGELYHDGSSRSFPGMEMPSPFLHRTGWLPLGVSEDLLKRAVRVALVDVRLRAILKPERFELDWVYIQAQMRGPASPKLGKNLKSSKSVDTIGGHTIVGTLHELQALGVGFVLLHEALDFTTPTGRALAGMLAVFAEFEREILRERIKAGIARARRRGRPHGRPATVARRAGDVRRLYAEGHHKSAIARQLRINRTSVRRFIG